MNSTTSPTDFCLGAAGPSTPSSCTSPTRVKVIRSPRYYLRSCLKRPDRRVSNQRAAARVSFADSARCAATKSVVEPHKRDHVQWRAETREERTKRTRAAKKMAAEAKRQEEEDLVEMEPQPSYFTDGDLSEMTELNYQHVLAEMYATPNSKECPISDRNNRRMHPALRKWSP